MYVIKCISSVKLNTLFSKGDVGKRHIKHEMSAKHCFQQFNVSFTPKYWSSNLQFPHVVVFFQLFLFSVLNLHLAGLMTDSCS